MNVRFADTEITDWDAHILDNPDGGNIFQGEFFAELKREAGWTPRYILADDIAITAIEKHLPLLGKVWYIPKGPGVDDIEVLEGLVGSLREFAKKQGVFTIKIEPELPKGTNMSHLGLRKTRYIQPNFATVVMNLEPSLDEMLKTMPQKGRYAIKRAKRDGVSAKPVPATDENCKLMYDLFVTTASDAGFGIRPADYYQKFWQGYEAAEIGQMFFAYYEGEVVAAAYALAYGTKGTYKDGASIRKRTAYGASHLLQWEVITWMKERGITRHDLCGAPPIDQASNPEHPWYGVGLFKRSFTPDITEYVGAYELPVQPLKSKLWTKFIEKLVRRVHYKLKHESFY